MDDQVPPSAPFKPSRPAGTPGHRSPDERLRDRAKIATWLIAGWTKHDIAVELGISRTAVTLDIKAIRLEWRAEARETMQTIADESIKRNLWVAKEAYREWARSQEDDERRHQEKTMPEPAPPGKEGEPPPPATGGSSKLSVTKSRALGDTKYLSIILQADENIRKLTGADQPTKIAPTSPDGKEAYDPMTSEERAMRVAEIMDRLKARAASAGSAEPR